MKTKNAKELVSIIILLLSNDYESVQLGISLFLGHYLITNYPKYKKFKVSLKYKGYQPPSQYCRSYSSREEEFNKNQFIKMLSSKSVEINKKVCAIINFIYDNTESRSRYHEIKNKKHKNLNYNHSLSHLLWGSSLDHLQVEEVKPCIYKTYKTTSRPVSKKAYRFILFQNRDLRNTEYLDISEGLIEDFANTNIDYCLYNGRTSWDIVQDYKQYLENKFKVKGRHCIKTVQELERILSLSDSFDLNKYYIDNLIFNK